MARNQQLSQLLNQLQAESGMSTLPASAVSTKEHRIQLLNRTQARLHAAFDWDFLFIKRDVQMNQGQRWGSFPSDMVFERVNQAVIQEAAPGSTWRGLGYGITEGDYNATAEGTQGCVQRWAPAENAQFELWPVPDQDYVVRFRGIKSLTLMVNENDRAMLDDTLIVLHAAAELMKRMKLPDWEDKQREAQLHFTRLRSMNGGNKRRPFINGGAQSGLIGDARSNPVRGLDYMTS